jgi:hypothetical protein
MPSDCAPVVASRIIPNDSERFGRAGQCAQNRRFQNVADILGILIANLVPQLAEPVISADTMA